VQFDRLHSENDTVDTINFEQVNEFAKLSLAFIVELAVPVDSYNFPYKTSVTFADNAAVTQKHFAFYTMILCAFQILFIRLQLDNWYKQRIRNLLWNMPVSSRQQSIVSLHNNILFIILILCRIWSPWTIICKWSI